ncbi:poly-gamma-glutamate hydrolase family protein [Priestia megaterium]|uniref:poly-gamma-glutamate hydrolase family protein n=1 Tax=Priestia megaterium TaxID=1404 RepID=UPI0015CF5876|nr:poly-gamma-glutamate hydrolase family protein [Priestia megaterium]
MADTYPNFEALQAVEQYDTDYSIIYGLRPSSVLFATPHGGGIETGASELAIESAGENHSYYCFEGRKASGNTTLHITSTNFDEPNLMRMIPKFDYVVTYHGYGDSAVAHTKIGGADNELKERAKTALTNAGFSCEILPYTDPIAGVEPDNLVNKGRRGMGLQLELSTLMRTSLFDVNTAVGRRTTQNATFKAYVKAILSCIPYQSRGR